MDKLIKALAIAIILFFVILAVVIGTRIDQYTIALLAGATLGLIIAAPGAALITYLAIRLGREETRRPDMGSHYGMPMPPPGWFGYPARQPHAYRPAMDAAAESFALPPRRRFYLIGEAGQATEIEPEQVDDYLT